MMYRIFARPLATPCRLIPGEQAGYPDLHVIPYIVEEPPVKPWVCPRVPPLQYCLGIPVVLPTILSVVVYAGPATHHGLCPGV